jgi:hypothetical protein
MQTFIHPYMHTSIHIHIHIRIHIHDHSDTYTSTYAHILIHKYTNIIKYTHIPIHIQTHTHIYIHIYNYASHTHTYIFVYIYMYMHTVYNQTTHEKHIRTKADTDRKTIHTLHLVSWTALAFHFITTMTRAKQGNARSQDLVICNTLQPWAINALAGLQSSLLLTRFCRAMGNNLFNSLHLT